MEKVKLSRTANGNVTGADVLVPEKISGKVTICNPAIPFPEIHTPRRTENRFWNKSLYSSVNSNIFIIAKKLETTRLSISRYTVMCPDRGILFSHETESNTDTCYNRDAPENTMLGTRRQTQKATRLHEMSRTGKSMSTERRLRLPGAGGGEMGGWPVTSMKFPSGVGGRSETGQRWWSHSSINGLETAELYTETREVPWCVRSISKSKEKRPWKQRSSVLFSGTSNGDNSTWIKYIRKQESGESGSFSTIKTCSILLHNAHPKLTGFKCGQSLSPSQPIATLAEDKNLLTVLYFNCLYAHVQ